MPLCFLTLGKQSLKFLHDAVKLSRWYIFLAHFK